MVVTGLISLPPGQQADAVVINQNTTILKNAIETLEGAGLNQQNPSVTTNVGNAYAVTHPYAPTALYNNFVVYITPTAENTGPATLQVASLPVKSITKWDNRPLDAGDLKVGIKYALIYDGTQFQIQAAPQRNFVEAIYYGLKCDGVTDDSPGLQRAADAVAGGDVLLPDAPIAVMGEVVCLKTTRFKGSGRDELYAELFSGEIPVQPQRGTRLIIKNNTGSTGFPRYLRSKSVYADDASDATDPAYNSVFNFQAIGCGLENMSIWIDMDVTNANPAYEGEVDLDCVVWASRPKCYIAGDVSIYGHTKIKTVLIDVTRNNPWREGNPQAAAVGQITLASSESTYADEYKNCYVEIVKGPGAGEDKKLITSYNQTTKVIVHAGAFLVTPTTASVYRITGREFSTPANHPNKPSATYEATIERGCDGFHVGYGARLWGCRAGVKTIGAEPKPGLDWYGYKYITSATVTFSGNPADGDTLTLAEKTFTFRTVATATDDIEIQSTATLTAKELEQACVDIIAAGPPTNFERAVYYADGAALYLYSRFDEDDMSGYVLSESSSNISLSGAAFSTTSDPAPYFDPVTQVLTKDIRGSFGASDFYFAGEVIQDHPSGWRRADPNYPMSASTVATDPMSFAIDLSGMAGNASKCIHRAFVGDNARFMVQEGVIRLNRHSRFMGDNFHSEWNRARYTSKGVPFATAITGTAQAGGASTITLAASHSNVSAAVQDTTNAFQGAQIKINTGTGAGQTNIIAAFNGATDVATVATAWGVQPDNTSTYTITFVRDLTTYRMICCQLGKQYVAPRLERIDQVPNYTYLPTSAVSFAMVTPHNGNTLLGGFLTVLRTFRTSLIKSVGNRLDYRATVDHLFRIGNGSRFQIFDTHSRFYTPARLAQYAVATIPTASSVGAGAKAWCTDASGGACEVVSNGTNWVRSHDLSTLS